MAQLYCPAIVNSIGEGWVAMRAIVQHHNKKMIATKATHHACTNDNKNAEYILPQCNKHIARVLP
jgi:hypothetical protein